jgi:hypothetical protein
MTPFREKTTAKKIAPKNVSTQHPSPLYRRLTPPISTQFSNLYLHPDFTLDLQRAPKQLQVGLKSVIERADKRSRAVILGKQNYIREDLTPTAGSSVLLTYPFFNSITFKTIVTS